MKYTPDSRQNCRPQLVRRMRSHPISAKPITTKRKTLAIHSRLVNHSIDQLMSIDPPSFFGPTEGRLTLTPPGALGTFVAAVHVADDQAAVGALRNRRLSLRRSTSE